MSVKALISDGSGSGRIAKVSDVLDGTNRLHVDAVLAEGTRVSIVPVGVTADNLSGLFRQFLSTDGTPTGPNSLIVNGSVTPQVFYLGTDPIKNTTLTEVRFTFTCLSIGWGGTDFGKGGGALTQGVKIELITNNGVYVDFGTIKVNEEFLMLPVRTSVVLDQSGNRDVLALSIDLGGLAILRAGTDDRIQITVQDNLTGGTRDINFFKFAAYGVKTDVQ